MIDLHSHTTASDGAHSPAELLALAAEAGVTVLAVTDHDTVDGIEAAQAAADELGVRLVPGLEISAVLNRREVHVLGHFVDPGFAPLRRFAIEVRTRRVERMQAMIDRLGAVGVAVTMADVEAVADGAPLGRPHLARALWRLGHVTSLQQAFDRYLGDGRPGAVVRDDVTPEQAIALIREAGGTATLAHPGSSRVNPLELEQLARAGLSGVEVHHVDHPPSLVKKLLKLCLHLGLVPTGGSDFHGLTIAPRRRLGCATTAARDFAALESRRP